VLVSRHKYTANALLITIIDQLSLALTFKVAVATLVSDTGFSRSTVFEALRYLEDEGMLERTHGPTVNTYRVRVENVWKALPTTVRVPRMVPTVRGTRTLPPEGPLSGGRRDHRPGDSDTREVQGSSNQQQVQVLLGAVRRREWNRLSEIRA